MDGARIQTLIEARRYLDAEHALKAHLAATPEDGTALCLLAEARLGIDDAEGALTAARAAARVLPGAELPHRLASTALLRLQRYDAADAAIEDALRLAPDEWRAHLLRAQICVASGQVTVDGRDSADRAAHLAPDSAAAHVAQGNVALADEDWKRARACFVTALRLDPDNADASRYLSAIGIQPHRLLRRSSGFVAAVRADPTSAAAPDNLAAALASALRAYALVLGLGVFAAVLLIQDERLSSGNRTLVLVEASVFIVVLVALAGLARRAVGRMFGPLLRRALRTDPLFGLFVSTVLAALALLTAASWIRGTSVRWVLGTDLVIAAIAWSTGGATARRARRLDSAQGSVRPEIQ